MLLPALWTSELQCNITCKFKMKIASIVSWTVPYWEKKNSTKRSVLPWHLGLCRINLWQSAVGTVALSVWSRLVTVVLRCAGSGTWSSLYCRWFCTHQTNSAACDAAAWRRIVLTLLARSELQCSTLDVEAEWCRWERRVTERCSSRISSMPTYAPTPASADVVSGVGTWRMPKRNNCTTLLPPWCDLVADLWRRQALSAAQLPARRHQRCLETGIVSAQMTFRQPVRPTWPSWVTDRSTCAIVLRGKYKQQAPAAWRLCCQHAWQDAASCSHWVGAWQL